MERKEEMVKVCVYIPKSLFLKVEEYRKRKERIPPLTATIRELVEKALAEVVD